MKNNSIRFSKEYIIISIILIITFVTRLYRIDNPIADWHSWRQADTSAVTRRYVNEGIDLLHPRYDDLSSIPSGKDNPEGWRFVEFPIINAFTALLYLAIPIFNVEIWGRLTSIIFSLGITIFIYLMMKYYFNKKIAFFSALIYSLLPFNLYYHRAVLPEVPLLFFSVGSLYFFIRWIDFESKKDFLLSAGFAMMGLLLKPVAVFMALPIFYVLFKKFGLSGLKKYSLFIYILLAILPFILWRLWITNFPEGIPAYNWLLNGSGIRFRPAFFRWIFAERIGKLILGYWGLIPFALGVIRKPDKKSGWLFHWWLISILLYLTIFATGNVTHDYYQIFIIPVLAIFMALGIDLLFHVPKQIMDQKISYLIAILSLILSFSFAWFHVRDFFNINHPEIVAAGEAANAILPQDAKVIAPYSGDTAFLYQTNRTGWPIGGNIEGKISLGATDYVTVNIDEEAELLLEKCAPSIKLDQLTLISLRSCNL